jgi:hypothetical protein
MSRLRTAVHRTTDEKGNRPSYEALIDRLLLERIALAGIARAAQVSEQWLQTYVNEKYAKVPRQVQVTPKKRGG